MADIKISELTAVSSLNNGDLVEVSQVNELAPSGYTSLKASMTDLGDKVVNDIEYTTDLADFTDKTITGAIKEVKEDLDDLTGETLPLTTNPADGTVSEAIGDLSDLTTTRKDSLVDAVNEVVSTKQNKITIATTTAGTTDNTGNIVVPDISPSTHMLLSAYKDRTLPNTDIAMSSIGVNATQTAYLVHLALTDGSPYASKSNVVLKIAYIAL